MTVAFELSCATLSTYGLQVYMLDRVEEYQLCWTQEKKYRIFVCGVCVCCSGTKPFLEHWRKWDFHALEPAGLMKVAEGKNDSSDPPRKGGP